MFINFIIFNSATYKHEENTIMIMTIRNLLLDYDYHIYL